MTRRKNQPAGVCDAPCAGPIPLFDLHDGVEYPNGPLAWPHSADATEQYC